MVVLLQLTLLGDDDDEEEAEKELCDGQPIAVYINTGTLRCTYSTPSGRLSVSGQYTCSAPPPPPLHSRPFSLSDDDSEDDTDSPVYDRKRQRITE